MNFKVDRRGFMGTALAAAAVGDSAWAANEENLPRLTGPRRGDMLYRMFGKTGETVSVPGVGGSHIGQTSSDALATQIVVG